MDGWPLSREVEKPKNVTERRQRLKATALQRVDQLHRRADAVIAVLGMHSPLVDELRATAQLVRELAAELRVPAATERIAHDKDTDALA